MGLADTYRTILPAGTVIAANGASAPVALTTNVDITALDVVVDISAVSGTLPTLTLTLERDDDDDTSDFPPAAWTAGTDSAALDATGQTTVSDPAALDVATGTCPRYYRVAWTVGGTLPSFTVGLYGE